MTDVLLCGTNFGRFHAAAIADHPRLRLTHILARGSAQSRRLAEEHGALLVERVDEVPDSVTLACVAVGSGIQGGPGSELAKALLERGISVLQEHPIHPDELTLLVRTAREHGAVHRVNLHYRNVVPVTDFLAAADRVRAEQPVRYVDVACPVHLLLPVIDVIAQAVGALRPHTVGEATAATPLSTLQLTIGGVPVWMRVQNQMSPAERDNHALLWPRISLGFDAGTLTLADIHGPVQWAPRLHLPSAGIGRFRTGTGTDLSAPTVVTLPGTESGPFADVFAHRWPAAIRVALDEVLDDMDSSRDALKAAAAALSVTRLWRKVAEALGPPEPIDPVPPRLLDLGIVTGERTDSHGWDGYDGEAEFFDLAARDHVASRSAPQILDALEAMPDIDAPIIEIGAGTGLLTELVARRTGARVWASEPSSSMRAALFSRIVDSPELIERVTVFNEDALKTEMPDRARAVLLCGVLGHLDAAEQDLLWERLRPSLDSQTPVLVELMGLSSPSRVDATELAAVELGEHTYRWQWGAEPDGVNSVRMRSVWSVHRGVNPVRSITTSHCWRTDSLADVAEISRRHGIGLVADLSTTSTPLGLFQLDERQLHG